MGVYVQTPISKSLISIPVVQDSGQCFNISTGNFSYAGCNEVYQIQAESKNCYITSKPGDGEYLLNCPEKDIQFWMSYLGVDGVHPYSEFLTEMCSSSNSFIKSCAEFSQGMTFLKQDVWQTIVSFIISQRRNIPSIRNSLCAMRSHYGKARLEMVTSSQSTTFTTFPTPEVLLAISEDELREVTSIGYRAEYVQSAASWYLQGGKEQLEKCKSYEEHMDTLMQIKGVGEKVASCISLFAFNDLEAFPIDTWIKKVLDKKLITDKEVKNCSYRGFLQQVIFNYVIHHKDEFK